jgi:hypothetical protein
MSETCWNDLSIWDKMGIFSGIVFVIVGVVLVFSVWLPKWDILTDIIKRLTDQTFVSGITVFALGITYLSFHATRK